MTMRYLEKHSKLPIVPYKAVVTRCDIESPLTIYGEAIPRTALSYTVSIRKDLDGIPVEEKFGFYINGSIPIFITYTATTYETAEFFIDKVLSEMGYTIESFESKNDLCVEFTAGLAMQNYATIDYKGKSYHILKENDGYCEEYNDNFCKIAKRLHSKLSGMEDRVDYWRREAKRYFTMYSDNIKGGYE